MSSAEGGAVSAMNPILAERERDLARLCAEHRVERLDVFGSAATGEFDPETSDLDFLVTFQEGGDAFSKQMNLQRALESLFGRKVDVIPERSITNPYFRANVEDTREAVYPNADNPPRKNGQGDKAVITRRVRISLLRDIVENGEEIIEETEGKTLEYYLRHRLLRRATERCHINIGEAMAQLARRAPETAERIANYREVIDFRNVLVHRYGDMDDERVWTHTVEDLPPLLARARELLAEIERA